MEQELELNGLLTKLMAIVNEMQESNQKALVNSSIVRWLSWTRKKRIPLSNRSNRVHYASSSNIITTEWCKVAG